MCRTRASSEMRVTNLQNKLRNQMQQYEDKRKQREMMDTPEVLYHVDGRKYTKKEMEKHKKNMSDMP